MITTRYVGGWTSLVDFLRGRLPTLLSWNDAKEEDLGVDWEDECECESCEWFLLFVLDVSVKIDVGDELEVDIGVLW